MVKKILKNIVTELTGDKILREKIQVLKEEKNKLLLSLIECINASDNGGRQYRGKIARDHGKVLIMEITNKSWQDAKGE